MSGSDDRVDVRLLLERVRAESRLRRGQVAAGGAGVDRALDLAPVEEMLRLADAKTGVRTALPRILRRFPFNRFRILERAVLKVYELLTREQRVAISHVSGAVRELLDGVRRVEEMIDSLQAEAREIQPLKARVKELEVLLAAEARRGPAAARPGGDAPGRPLDGGQLGR